MAQQLGMKHMSLLIHSESDRKRDLLKPYFREIREAVSNWIQQPQTPVYLCMESQTVWKNTFGYIPKNEIAIEKKILFLSC